MNIISKYAQNYAEISNFGTKNQAIIFLICISIIGEFPLVILRDRGRGIRLLR